MEQQWFRMIYSRHIGTASTPNGAMIPRQRDQTTTRTSHQTVYTSSGNSRTSREIHGAARGIGARTVRYLFQIVLGNRLFYWLPKPI
jgi:hypothetical protein